MFFFLIGFFLVVYFIDSVKPQNIARFWSKNPSLDRLYSLTKFTDYLDPRWVFYKDNLETYKLIISNAEMLKIKKSLPPAFNHSFYLAKDYYWAPAEFVYKDKNIPVKVRVRGDLYSHWSNEKKSYRIRFKNKEDFLFPELNFIIPEGRDFFSESLANFRAEKLGLIHLKSWYSNLNINGQNQGIYFIQEQWNKEFIERHGLNSQGDLYGEQDLSEGFYWPQLFSGIDAWKNYFSEKNLQGNDFNLDYFLRLVDKKTPDNEFKEKIFDILDKENFFSWQVHAMISSSYHEDWGHNLRLFFNEEKGKFQFIPYDVEPNFNYQKSDKDYYFIDFDYNPLVTRILLIPELRLLRDRHLYDYVKNEKNLEADLAYWDQLFNELKPSFLKDRLKPYSNRYFINQIFKYRNHFIGHFYNIRKVLEDNNVKIEILKSKAQDLKVKITNQASSSILLQKINLYHYDGKELISKTVNKQIDSLREAQIRENEELYGLIKVIPNSQELTLALPKSILDQVDFSKTKFQFINLVTEKTIDDQDIILFFK